MDLRAAALGEFRALRLAMGLTQKQAAVRLGLATSTVAVYEGGHGNVTEARLRELITKLGESRVADDSSQVGATNVGMGTTPQSIQRYIPKPRRIGPRVKVRTCPLPRGAVDENEPCICGSPRKRHDALKFSCQDCRRGASGCQYFRPASRFNGAG